MLTVLQVESRDEDTRSLQALRVCAYVAAGQRAAGKEKIDRTHQHFCTRLAPHSLDHYTEHCAQPTRLPATPPVRSAPPDVTCEREGVWVVSWERE